MQAGRSLLAIAALLAIAPPAHADDGLTPPPGQTAADARRQVVKGGPEAKFVLTETYSGVLYGVRAGRFFTDAIYGGILSYGALPLIGKEFAPAFGYVGVLAGYEGKLPVTGLGYDLNLMGAWTQNLFERDVGQLPGQPLVEPSVSLSLPVPIVRGMRASMALGYLFMPLSRGLSGPTIGLRVDFKALEYRFALDD